LYDEHGFVSKDNSSLTPLLQSAIHANTQKVFVTRSITYPTYPLPAKTTALTSAHWNVIDKLTQSPFHQPMTIFRIAPWRTSTPAAPVRAAGPSNRAIHLVALSLLAAPAFAAFPNGYTYCKVITTQHIMVSGSGDLANYPLTVILADAALKTVANGGLVNNSSGYDIGFGPDCSGSATMLNWELESYTPATGAIVAHLLRPTLSHTADDTVGLYYGGAFNSSQSTPSAVWDTSYKGVWHLSDVPAAAKDSTSGGIGNGAVTAATTTPGPVGGGAAFLAANIAHIDIGRPNLS
jgi:hypothetical protein